MIRGDRLRELRKQKGLSQIELADIVGVSKSSISGYEKETRSPKDETIMDFIELFNVTSDYLLGCEKKIKIHDKQDTIVTLSEEDILFLEELKKNKTISNLIIENPKRTAELIKNKIG